MRIGRLNVQSNREQLHVESKFFNSVRTMSSSLSFILNEIKKMLGTNAVLLLPLNC